MTDCHLFTIPMEEGVQFFIDMDLNPTKKSTYQNIISSLIYYRIKRPYLVLINCLNKFVLAPQDAHMVVAKKY